MQALTIKKISWHTGCNPSAPMQTSYPESMSPATFFSRERRRQRMLQFLEAFERRSWRCSADVPFLFPLPKDDLREPAFSASGHPPHQSFD
jgi:hypothetical protein